MLFLFHIALAVTLFFLVNWIGEHSFSRGYLSLSMFVRKDEAPAFNFLFRVLAPLVFIVIVASALFGLHLDGLVRDLWLVVPYYFALRLAYNCFRGRLLLLNWGREFALWALTVGAAWLLFDRVIRDRETLMPDVATLTNELWVVIALFLYATLNNVRLGPGTSERRKDRFIRHAYARYNRKYHDVIRDVVPDIFAESLVYAILIYEGFNRSAGVRAVEYALFPWWSRSLGPMQVQTDRRLSATESVRLGAVRVSHTYQHLLTPATGVRDGVSPSLHDRWSVVPEVAAEYNRDEAYVNGIEEAHAMVVERFYPSLKQFELDGKALSDPHPS